MSQSAFRNALAPGQSIGAWRIEKILGQGGFGITYLAHDEKLERKLAIKEYFPTEFCRREPDGKVMPQSAEDEKIYAWGLERFLGEGKTLARFKHPNIVRVIDYLELNNTACIVMEYEQGQDLQEILKRRKSLPVDELLAIFVPLLDGLAEVHKAGFIHRDIKPANIFIRNDGSPVLIDFGSSRQGLASKTRNLTTLVSPGYAPFEQYNSDGASRQGPWTDIYALGASMYRALFGRSPPDAMQRAEQRLAGRNDPQLKAVELGKDHYPLRLLEAIDHALQFQPEDRPQTIQAWLSMIKSVDGVASSPADYIATVKMDPPPEARPATVPAAQTVRIDLDQPGLRLAVTRYLVFGMLSMWSYTAYSLCRKLQQYAGQAGRLHISPLPGHLFAAVYLIVMLMVLSWVVPNVFMGYVLGEPYILRVVLLTSMLFYLNTAAFVVWYMRQLKTLDLLLLEQKIITSGGIPREQVNPARNELVGKWEQLDNHVMLFLIMALPITGSPYVSAGLFYNATAQSLITALPVIVMLLGGIFHVWGTRLLVNSYNQTLAR